jgi:hypothetical protein
LEANSILKSCEQQLTSIKDLLSKEKAKKNQSNHATLIHKTDQDVKGSIVSSTKSLDKSSKILKQALGEAHATASLGIQTLETMNTQTTQLADINDKLNGVNEKLYVSKQIMKKM